MESSQTQIKYIMCKALSLIALFSVLFVLIWNQNRVINLLCLFLLLSCLAKLYLKLQRIRAQQGSLIHENNYFSYQFSPDIENNQENINGPSRSNSIQNHSNQDRPLGNNNDNQS